MQRRKRPAHIGKLLARCFLCGKEFRSRNSLPHVASIAFEEAGWRLLPNDEPVCPDHVTGVSAVKGDEKG